MYKSNQKLQKSITDLQREKTKKESAIGIKFRELRNKIFDLMIQLAVLEDEEAIGKECAKCGGSVDYHRKIVVLRPEVKMVETHVLCTACAIKLLKIIASKSW